MKFWILSRRNGSRVGLLLSIESTKTTSMEDGSTAVLEKIKNISEVKIKPKNDMMYQDIYNCICQNTKIMKICYPECQTYSPNGVKKSISKKWTNMQESCGLSTTPNVARAISCKAWNSPTEYPSWVARCDINGSDSIMLNPIFWKKVRGQKHPGRWYLW